MARKPLGCFSGTALAAVVVTVFAIVGSARLTGGGLFSPGALSAQSTGVALGNVASHAALGGRCAACHPAPWDRDTMADRCMACHTDIKGELAQPAALHAAYLKAQGQADCRPCHPEHGGASGSLTVVREDTFPHEATGFALTAHKETKPGVAFTCADCHDNDLLHFSQSKCSDCHALLDGAFMQPHEAAYGIVCLTCHDGVDTYGKAFDHNKAAFHLSGKHATTGCGGCHTGARTPADLKATRSRCVDCHARDDFHKGQLGPSCGECHSTAAFKPASIDHNSTSFPLAGKHATADCVACHIDNVYKGTPRSCAACHTKDDVHKSALGADCQACHTAAGWTPATFDHAKAIFPLTGKHVSVACADCHADKTFKGTPQNCAGCHLKDDVHKSKLGADCATCHTAADWKQSIFDHSKAAFPLAGKHATVSCTDCHADETYAGTPQNCSACHLKDDAHGGRLGANCGACHNPADWKQATIDHSLTGWPLAGKHASATCVSCHVNDVWHGIARDCFGCHQKDDAHNGKFGQACEQCHTPVDWKQATFDHSRVNFPLLGKHASVACLNCHANGFQGTPAQCAACHARDDAHGGKFGNDCGSCHTSDGWKPANFDHARVGFPLTGAHTGVPCLSCHPNTFAGTPAQCAACHQKDDAHGGKFGNDCGSCHNTSSWKQATFDHGRVNFPLTGAHTNVPCLSCHANGFPGTPSQCVACHARNDAHGGKFGTDCGSCHNTTSWQQATFDHSRVNFPLTGAHAGVPCQNCHTNGFANPLPAQCGACHAKNDAHNGQFGADCGACHNTTSWQGASFDHSKSGFPLTGAHAGVPCQNCHTNGYTTPPPTQCVGCHAKNDAHNGQFGTQCGACHNTTSWQGASFDHSKSGFPLTGAHAGVPCQQCHTNGYTTPPPAACEGCHGQPAYHAGLFPTGCGSCHNTSAWTPATFNQPHQFPINHGRANSCRSCHPANLNTWTCSVCHSDAQMASQHRGVAGYSGNCIACHPTGQSGD